MALREKSAIKIVVTDGYTLNSGDLSWEGIEALGNLQLYERTTPNQVIERCIDAAIVVTNKIALSDETISRLPKLKFISVLATGYNLIDVKKAREKNIPVSNVPGYGTASVAQHAFALVLELTNAVGLHAASVKKGDWTAAADWCYTKQPLIELSGKTLGIIGFGNIGQQVAKIASAFNMKVIYYNPNDKPSPIAVQKSLQEVFREADFVSLHCPVKAGNEQFVNKELLSLMKKTAYLVNTSRGQLINEKDLADALNNRVIAGAALDVLSTEPPEPKNPLLLSANCIITPHNAWMSKEARQRVMAVTEHNIKAFLSGKPINVVN